MKSVEQNHKWLARFLDFAQQPESERDLSSAGTDLRNFANSLLPNYRVNWNAEPFGAPRVKPLKMMEPRKAAERVKSDKCRICGRAGVRRVERNKWDAVGGWYCETHTPDEAEDATSDGLLASMLKPDRPKPDQPVAETGTDTNALFQDVLTGLNSLLNQGEWEFPPVTLTATVGIGQDDQPERVMMGSLRDVVLARISDLLMEHGHKIRRCKARNCTKAFLSIRRQTFCSSRCASNTRSDRFQKELGKEKFRERRHRYYEKAQRIATGNPKLRVGRRQKRSK